MQVVLVVLVVIELMSIASLKVKTMSEFNATEVAESTGAVEDTVGAIVSTVNEVKVMVFPVFPAGSVIVTVQSE